MDKVVIIFLIILSILIKIIFIDNYCYESLRLKHSKTYIRKNFGGAFNKIFYNKYFREISIIPLLANYFILLMMAVLFVVLIISFFINLDMVINTVICIYGFVAVIYFLLILFDFVILNKNSKGEKSSILSRLIVGLIFLVLAILCLSKI